MKHPQKTNWLTLGLGLGSTLLLGMNSCQNDGEGGIVLPAAGNAGSETSGGSDPGTSGSAGTESGAAGMDEAGGSGGAADGASGSNASGEGGEGGKSGSNASGGSSGEADSGTGGENTAGEAGAAAQGSGGTNAGGTSGVGGTGGDAGTGNAGAGGTGGTSGDPPLATCIFNTEPGAASGGVGGGPAAPGGVDVATSPFLGPYLTDLAGIALYIYGADVPGDCNNAPVSNCTADCLIAWPLFDAKERSLDETLDSSVFGTFDRGDGTFQTTYYGWPLYYYKTDLAPGTINGQGKGKTWFAAEVALPNLMIMRGSVAGGGIKYLGDDRGYTLYSLTGDTIGTGETAPASACTGSCLDSFSPYAPDDVYPVTPLEPHDIALFVRGDGALQTAYKGAPLYYSKLDVRAGEQNGLSLLGGALVLP